MGYIGHILDIWDILDILDILDVLDIFYMHETYLRQNVVIKKRKRRSGRSVNRSFVCKIKCKVQTLTKNIMLSTSLCGNFALGIFSKTYVKDVGFEMNVCTTKNI